MSVVVDSLYINTPVIELYPSDFVIIDGKAKLIYDRFPEIFGLPGFVEFYAPWCPHCVNFVSDYLTLADVAYGVDGINPIFSVTAFNCTHPDCAPFLEAIGVSTFPSFFGIGADGYLIEYGGSRKQKSFLGFLCNTNGICDLV
jgi:hypothetical protein